MAHYFESFDGSSAWHFFLSSERAFLYHAREVLCLSPSKPQAVWYVALLFTIKGSLAAQRTRENRWRNKRVQTHAVFCRDKREWRRNEPARTESGEERRKQWRQKTLYSSFFPKVTVIPFNFDQLSASLLLGRKEQAAPENTPAKTHTHSETNINTSRSWLHKESHSQSVKTSKRERQKEVISCFSFFFLCMLRHDKLCFQTVDEKRQPRNRCPFSHTTFKLFAQIKQLISSIRSLQVFT